MVEAARAGGSIALEHYRRQGFAVSLKADRSPVTEADRAAERAILDVLRARCPDHGALGDSSWTPSTAPGTSCGAFPPGRC